MGREGCVEVESTRGRGAAAATMREIQKQGEEKSRERGERNACFFGDKTYGVYNIRVTQDPRF
jgi:hypothetical protein